MYNFTTNFGAGIDNLYTSHMHFLIYSTHMIIIINYRQCAHLVKQEVCVSLIVHSSYCTESCATVFVLILYCTLYKQYYVFAKLTLFFLFFFYFFSIVLILFHFTSFTFQQSNLKFSSLVCLHATSYMINKLK